MLKLCIHCNEPMTVSSNAKKVCFDCKTKRRRAAALAHSRTYRKRSVIKPKKARDYVRQIKENVEAEWQELLRSIKG